MADHFAKFIDSPERFSAQWKLHVRLHLTLRVFKKYFDTLVVYVVPARIPAMKQTLVCAY
jgi:hypothetical protein